MIDEENLFAVRSEIAEKLKEIAGFKMIYTPANSANISELTQVTPNVQVYYRRMRKADEAGKSSASMIAQQYEVTVVNRHAASQLSNGSDALDLAGKLSMRVLKLLSGWRPASSVRPLEWIAVEEDYSATCVYITVVFESKLFI